jgi:hypothetical protein
MIVAAFRKGAARTTERQYLFGQKRSSGKLPQQLLRKSQVALAASSLCDRIAFA